MKIGFFTSGFYAANDEAVKAIEHWTYQLAKELEGRGHEIHFFCHPDSNNGIKKAIYPKYGAKFINSIIKDDLSPFLVDNFCDFVSYANANNLDLIHDQTTVMPTSLSRFAKMPVVCSVHGVLDNFARNEYYSQNKHSNLHYVAVSDFVKNHTKGITFDTRIHHGIDVDDYTFYPEGKYFLSLGRIVPNKGQADAIRAAGIAKVNFVLAGYKSDYDSDDDYYNEVVNEVANNPSHMRFIGKVPKQSVPSVMGNAKGFLMPIKWDEAFGLVMIEALAAGTPVIAYNRGAVPEIIKDGINGFVVEPDNIEALAEAIKNIDKIDRRKCRESVINNFNLETMVSNYENFYKSLLIK